MSNVILPTAHTRIALSPRAAALLGRAVRGKGGYQVLLRRVQPGLDGLSLHLAADDLRALERAAAASSGRPGGFQQRIRALVADVLDGGAVQPGLPFLDGSEQIVQR